MKKVRSVDLSVDLGDVDGSINDRLAYRQGLYLVCTTVELPVANQMNEVFDVVMEDMLIQRVIDEHREG